MSSGADLNGRYIQIAGSANPSCPHDKLRLAHQFVRALAKEVLAAGGKLVLFVSNDPRTHDDEKLPLVFGWQILDELRQFVSQPPTLTEPRAVLITSKESWTARITQEQRELLSMLMERNALQTDLVPDDIHTGGNIRDKQCQWADALVTLGGGKGISDLAHKMLKKKAPIVPLDLKIGAINADGTGSLGLLEHAEKEPERFFPGASERFRQSHLELSLEVPGADPARVAHHAIDLLCAAFSEARASQPVEVLFLTALPIELEILLKALGSTPLPSQKHSSGTNYWLSELDSRRQGRPLRVALGCIGTAGNLDAAAMTAESIALFRPSIVIMIGIAAGIRGKCRLGEVVLSERVVAYEPAAEVVEQGQSQQQTRPEIFRLAHPLRQDAVAYVCSPATLEKRLTAALEALGLELPQGDPSETVRGIVARLATVASGEKLLRNPEKLAGLRRSLHGKIEVGEMEAAGVATACTRANTPFLIVRGISDFGDESKDDRFHEVASAGAVLVAIDFVREALAPGPERPSQRTMTGRT